MAKEKEQKKEVSKKDTKKATTKKENKKSIFKSISSYFKGVKKEVSRIRWTKGKDLLKYSITTIIFIVFLGAFFYVIDLLVALLRSSL